MRFVTGQSGNRSYALPTLPPTANLTSINKLTPSKQNIPTPTPSTLLGIPIGSIDPTLVEHFSRFACNILFARCQNISILTTVYHVWPLLTIHNHFSPKFSSIYHKLPNFTSCYQHLPLGVIFYQLLPNLVYQPLRAIIKLNWTINGLGFGAQPHLTRACRLTCEPMRAKNPRKDF